MNHQELLNLALEIQNNQNPSEVKVRNAMGRLYYFAYHETLLMIQGNDGLKAVYDQLSGGSHEKVLKTFIEYYRLSQNYDAFEFGQKLEFLRNSRNIADYKLDRTLAITNFNTMLTQLKKLKELSNITKNQFFQMKIRTVIHTQPNRNTTNQKPSKLRVVED